MRQEGNDTPYHSFDYQGTANCRQAETARAVCCVESLVNEELPLLVLHHLTALQAGVMHPQRSRPAISGPFNIRGGGIRAAWLA
jgi:hypothetical protein